MDEPFSGLDPVNVQLLKEAFLEMRDRGKTLIFSTHQMETVEELCESIAIIDRGRVVVHGQVRDVKRAMGRRVVRLATDGDGNGAAWLPKLAGVRLIAQRAGLRRAGRSRPAPIPELILRAAPRARRAGDALRDRRSLAGGGLHRARRAAGGCRGGAPPRRSAPRPSPPRIRRRMSDLFPNAWHDRAARVPAARPQPQLLHRHAGAGAGGRRRWPCCRWASACWSQRERATPRRLPARLHRFRPTSRDASGSGARQRSGRRTAPDYVVTTVDDPEAARGGGPRRRAGRAADHRARRRWRPLATCSYTDEGLTGGTPTAIRTAVYQVSVGDRLQRAGVGARGRPDPGARAG